MCAKETVIITSGLLERLTKQVYCPSTIYSHNQPAIVLAKSPGAPKLSHVTNLNFHIIRNYVQNNKIALNFVRSANQPADTLTKPLAAEKFKEHRKFLLNN